METPEPVTGRVTEQHRRGKKGHTGVPREVALGIRDKRAPLPSPCPRGSGPLLGPGLARYL